MSWLLLARFLLAPPLARTDAEVARVVGGNLRAVRSCWERERAGKDAGGRAMLALEIAPSGEVQAARVDGPPGASAELAACVRERVLAWRFPPSKGGPARFSFPLLFVGR